MVRYLLMAPLVIFIIFSLIMMHYEAIVNKNALVIIVLTMGYLALISWMFICGYIMDKK